MIAICMAKHLAIECNSSGNMENCEVSYFLKWKLTPGAEMLIAENIRKIEIFENMYWNM